MDASEVFLNIGDWAGAIVDIIEFIGISVAVITFIVVAFLPLMRPVRRFLGKYKMPGWDSLWLVWKCRSKPSLFTRYYIESAIFHSEGYPMDKAAWKELRHIFSDRLDDYRKNGEFVIPVDSVSVMISGDVKAMIAEYFSFLAGERGSKKFWTKANVDKDESRKDAFCATVSVSNGYLAPIARIAGINDRYEEDWKAIMESFNDTCNDSLMPQSVLSYTFTWLMWGPSIQTSLLNAEGTNVLGVYGFGDEANSFFTDIPRSSFKELFNKGVLCEPSRISGHIVNPIIYVPETSDKFNTDSLPFLERIRFQYRESPEYIFDADKIEVVEEHDHYFTAYVWGMFLASKKKEGKPEYRFTDAVAFFEHTNLSDRDSRSLESVNKILARKFRSVFEGYKEEGVTFHFVTSINDDTAKVLKNELQDLPNVSFKHKYSIAEILEAIDSHFNSNSWKVLPRQSYGDLIDLCRDIEGEGSDAKLAELFGMLAGRSELVISKRNQQGSLDAAAIADVENGLYKIKKVLLRSTSAIRPSDVMSLSDRDIRGFRSE